MQANRVDFSDTCAIGQVTSVDTSKVYIRVDDHDLLRQVIVGHLVAIQGGNAGQYLIAIVDRITRLPGTYVQDTEEIEEPSSSSGENIQDTMRVVLVGTYWVNFAAAGPRFKRGADSCPQIDQSAFLLQAGNLTAFMSTLAGGVDASSSLEIGDYVIDSAAQAIADGDRFFQRHAAIVGSTGSGKSWTVAMLLERAARLMYSNLIVLDMHGEYASLADGSSGIATRFRIAGPGDLASPGKDVLFLPHWLLNREEMLGMILDRSDQNAPNQATVFTREVRRLKEQSLLGANRTETLKTFTVDSPVPYDLGLLVSSLESLDIEMVPGARGEKQGEWYGKLTRFLARLDAKLTDRRYGFLFQAPPECSEYAWLEDLMVRLMSVDNAGRGIKIVDFSEVPGDVLPVVAGVFARMLYDVQFWMSPESRTPVCLVCDEAHLYLPVREGADAATKGALLAFERIAKEGRKYGVGLLVVSQRPSDVSRTILSQCNNYIALRLTNEQDQSAVKSVVPDALAGITDVLPLLDVGEAIVLGDAVLLPSRVKLARPEREPMSLTRRFWHDWGFQRPDNYGIKGAVEALRRQSRGV